MCHKITNKSNCEKTGKSGDFRNAERGNYIHCLKTKGGRYFGQVITSEESIEGYQPIINLKEPNMYSASISK